jgi:hypothetical protein
MKKSARYWRGRVRYTGKIDRSAFRAWCHSADGWSVIKPMMARMSFSIFGRRRAAERRLWRELTHTAGSATFAPAMQEHVDWHVGRLGTIVYARDLPAAGVDLRRLIAVPSLFANEATDRALNLALNTQATFASGNGRESLRNWFLLMLIDQLSTAVADARPSPQRPLPAGRDWMIVGVNSEFEWRVPFQGPDWRGHYYLLERTHQPITRAVRKAALDAMAAMEASLAGLSRAERNEILREADLSARRLLAKAG